MTILDKIIADKRREVLLKKTVIPVKQLEASVFFERQAVSLSTNLREGTRGIIAEHKRRSPSKSIINNGFSVEDVIKGYDSAGAAGISVLTDAKYFGGSLEDLVLARASTAIPLLRKEFIIDEYQIIEAKANGADLILLIASVLTRNEIESFSKCAKSIGLEVLLEIHNEQELEKSLMPSLDMIGVNNRNLATFEVSLNNSKALSARIPSEFVKISESGISSVEDIVDLEHYGFKGFLVGETFMKTTDAGQAAADFIKKVQQR
ncbi:indole-3-glycerol phosphate synthase TrpC [Flavobacterium antarcticum]|uniref:indole-3-glycerol phosphate synthase TrpC n=1 Tax=Flavobacterium antarcticum TaxID=271155 RepID=UPI0003B543BA|nr:indole-3-glycerol phosphate synthase TrpC [Flavobacterium antarcticum]